MTEPEYDEATCITARELRAQGIAVGEEIPDPAWVRRDSIRFGVGGVQRDPKVPGRMSIGIGVTFTEPFRCIALEIVDGPIVIVQNE